ncbi:MAG: oxaloacetate decarboxylase [Dehalococcoidia bacterium]
MDQQRPAQSRAAALRARLAKPEILVVPGAADALTARLIGEAGFAAVYATGAGIANVLLGLPDLGLTTMTEIVDQVRRIGDAVEIPLIADADTGFGNPLNVRRTVREIERAGAAGIQLEDQVSPKRCGHFAGKDVIDADEMVQKVRAACDARQDPDTIIVARTDAIAVLGVEEAIRRARLYHDAGADVIFVEAPTDRDTFAALPRQIDAPLLANMTEGGRSPLLPASELQAMGYKIALFPNTALRLALKAVQSGLQTLAADGGSAALLDRLLPWDERQRVVGLPEYEQLERRYVTRYEEKVS